MYTCLSKLLSFYREPYNFSRKKHFKFKKNRVYQTCINFNYTDCIYYYRQVDKKEKEKENFIFSMKYYGCQIILGQWYILNLFAVRKT